MAHNHQQSFWDFINSYEPNSDNQQQHWSGVGVDRAPPSFGGPAGFWGGPEAFEPWGGRGRGGPWGGWGRRGPWGGPGHRHGRHAHHHGRDGPETDREENAAEERNRSDMEDSPDTMRDAPAEGPAGSSADAPPPNSGHPHDHEHHGPHGFGHHGPGPHRRRGGGCRGRGGPRGFHAHAHAHPYGGPFDFRPLMQAFASHPFAQALQSTFEQAQQGQTGESATENRAGQAAEQGDDSFSPPVDIFSTEKTYVLHIALPGAVKEDVGVNWNADQGVLNVAGVVYRPGNEVFLSTLTSSERKIGMFERSIKLPPAGSNDKEEVDGFSITATMENGILIVTVPKFEKEWTEVHKIDVE
jgi:HSP20 family protein